jgi:hypothetical protein
MLRITLSISGLLPMIPSIGDAACGDMGMLLRYLHPMRAPMAADEV